MSSSFSSCSSISVYTGAANYKRMCIFEGVSPCRDQVSHVICNAHSRLFGLIHKSNSYRNDSGLEWVKINVYAMSQNSLTIPMFIDNYNKVLMSEIKNFTMNVCNKNPNIRVDVLQDRIAHLVGINLFGPDLECEPSWLSEASTNVLIHKRDDNAFLTELPQLHRLLLFYANPSNIKNESTGSGVYLIPNLTVVLNEQSNMFTFVVPTPNILLKYTDDSGCVATPLVIDALRVRKIMTSDRIYQPVHRPYSCA